MSMAHDREEHNPQQARDGNGVGRSRKKNQEISEGDLPKQNERKRGRPRSELSEQQQREKHNASCRKSRKKKNALRDELQDFKNEFQEEFGSLRPRSLKETLSKLGVPEVVLEDIRKGTSCEELEKVLQTLKEKVPAQKEILQDKMQEDLSDGAEFSIFQKTEIKETMCTEEGLEDKEKRTFRSEECLEKRTKFLFEDEMTEPSDVSNEELTKIMVELEDALIGSESTTLGSKEVPMMNEPTDPDGLLGDDEVKELLSWLNTNQDR